MGCWSVVRTLRTRRTQQVRRRSLDPDELTQALELVRIPGRDLALKQVLP